MDKKTVAVAGFLCCAAVLAGCGDGSGSTPAGQSAYCRAVHEINSQKGESDVTSDDADMHKLAALAPAAIKDDWQCMIDPASTSDDFGRAAIRVSDYNKKTCGE
ncbi:hypothetical protein VMT65_23115 [Nocardia sp. CDC153]|nr:hypothetical protein [Nocardia sp. CDC153]